MSKYRHALPQLSSRFLTDGGMETTFIFHERVELPHFASFRLMQSEDGRARLRRYAERYIAIAKAARMGFLFDGPTWRASPDWAEKFGISPAELAKINRDSIQLMAAIRDRLETRDTPIVLSGAVGPRGDGYRVGAAMTAAEAEDYHAEQIRVFAATQADMVSAYTLNYVAEAIGIARAADAAGMPAAISFTLETDGRLPGGETLKEAILAVDRATGATPAYFMINCAHPTHFAGVLDPAESWVGRIRGIRANASKRSHAELDAAADLDDGDPAELGQQYGDLVRMLPHLTVFGGCCGTDHRHVEAIASSCAAHGQHAAHAA